MKNIEDLDKIKENNLVEWLNNFVDYIADFDFDLYEEARDYSNGIKTKNKINENNKNN